MKYNETLMWKEINETPQMFQKIYDANSDKIDALVGQIKQRKIGNVYAVARGTSDHALIYFKYAVEIMSGLPVALGAPGVVTLYDGAIDFSSSLVIGCSQSGKAADVLEVLKRANSQGGLTVSVTNDQNSPVSKEAAYHLFCSAGEEKSVAATKTFSAQLYVLLLFAAKLAGNGSLLGGLTNLGKKTAEDIIDINLLTEKYADKYKDMKSGFVLSRGVTYPIALEASLKLQETSYIHMKGYATSDFFHGPMAMVSENTPVLIYAARYNFENASLKENFIADQIKGIEKMLELKAPVLIITDEAELNAKYSKVCDVAYLPECQNEYFTMFSFALFAQMFACKVSCGIGNNPDSPRALKKVTITK